MNTFLAARYSETISRLALGVEITDALTGGAVADFVKLTVDAPGLPGQSLSGPAALRSHGRGRWSTRYRDGGATPTAVDLRIQDPLRRHVPRRLHVAIPSLATVQADEALAPPVTTPGRSWKVTLYPGAAYPLPSGATAIRGRVLRSGKPVRWARIEARTVVGAFAGRAHGDDRGEFLLVVDAEIGDTAELKATVLLELRARGPEPAPTTDAATAAGDPLWDLPLETPSSTGPVDLVTAGIARPTAYDPGATSPWTTVTCQLGSDISCPTPFVLA